MEHSKEASCAPARPIFQAYNRRRERIRVGKQLKKERSLQLTARNFWDDACWGYLIRDFHALTICRGIFTHPDIMAYDISVFQFSYSHHSLLVLNPIRWILHPQKRKNSILFPRSPHFLFFYIMTSDPHTLHFFFCCCLRPFLGRIVLRQRDVICLT